MIALFWNWLNTCDNCVGQYVKTSAKVFKKAGLKQIEYIQYAVKLTVLLFFRLSNQVVVERSMNWKKQKQKNKQTELLPEYLYFLFSKQLRDILLWYQPTDYPFTYYLLFHIYWTWLDIFEFQSWTYSFNHLDETNTLDYHCSYYVYRLSNLVVTFFYLGNWPSQEGAQSQGCLYWRVNVGVLYILCLTIPANDFINHFSLSTILFAIIFPPLSQLSIQ